MAKAVRWKIPFKSVGGTSYRIDIYDEGFTGTAVQLLGGPQPFVTEESADEDFFAPVRTQSGNIQICTALPNGGTLRLDDILPANNIARPVRLMRGTTIEWQGFLSCEAYSQEYTSIPQILTLPVISVLEAIGSVQLNQSRSIGFVKLNAAIYAALNEITVQCGMTCFTHINYSQTDKQIFTKYIDQTVLFNLKEYCNDTGVTFDVEGISAKEALERLCILMGWTAREQGSEIYLERLDEQFGMRRDTLANFNVSFDTSATDAALVSKNMSALTWRGADHKRSIEQGAKSVQVAAAVDDYKLGVAIPPTPKVSMEQNPAARSASGWGWINANTLINYYPNSYFRTLGIRWDVPNQQGDDAVLTIISSQTTLVNRATVMWEDVDWYDDFDDIAEYNPPQSEYQHLATSFLGILFFGGRDNESQEGLMVYGTPNRLYNTGVGYINVSQQNLQFGNHIFLQRSVLNFRASSGYLRLNIQVTACLTTGGMQTNVSYMTGAGLAIGLQFANKWLAKNGNTYSWVDGFNTIILPIDNEGKGPQNYDGHTEERDGLFIPVPADNLGEVSIYIFNQVEGRSQRYTITGFFISSFEVDYVPKKDELRQDNGTNKYFKLLGTNFRDDIVIQSPLATSVNNNPSPSLIMDSASVQTTYLDYKTGTNTTEARRPEKDLLNRLASYYGAARQQLKLEVTHPTDAPLARLKLNGINDGKKYLPLAESRDWAEDKSTITCFETVNA